ncbi:hypothetical protein FQZ97_1052900 [compost metagenome]
MALALATGHTDDSSAYAPSCGYTKPTGKPVSANAFTRPLPQTEITAWPLENSSVILPGDGS